MKTKIAKAQVDDIEQCIECIENSSLHNAYFSEENALHSSLQKGIETEEVFVCKNETGRVIGFVWYTLNGAFHSFPYLHIIAVHDHFRGKGIGSSLLHFVETHLFAKYNKLFLATGDFNPRAKRFYIEKGYVEVGKIPSLYREGVTEYLMMKEKNT